MSPALLFIVTTSPSRDWVICAPAAFLGCGSRFSGSLSGVPHPRSVTRWNHGKTLPYHRKLIGQKFERCVDLRRSERRLWITNCWCCYLNGTMKRELHLELHVLALELLRLSVSKLITEEIIAVLPSHSQFRLQNNLYLDLHGLVFETSIYHWQDQPGSDTSMHPLPHSGFAFHLFINNSITLFSRLSNTTAFAVASLGLFYLSLSPMEWIKLHFTITLTHIAVHRKRIFCPFRLFRYRQLGSLGSSVLSHNIDL